MRNAIIVAGALSLSLLPFAAHAQQPHAVTRAEFRAVKADWSKARTERVFQHAPGASLRTWTGPNGWRNTVWDYHSTQGFAEIKFHHRPGRTVFRVVSKEWIVD